ncbi:28S ribosomal protein S16, mitochondrial, partial [Pipra filicauda]|uniref:Small ribosomal subunit protein bS16m n=1 Tax=Pipra filicauda TaxID=649802 RepID=A0A7R5KV16_9PASS
PAPARPVTGPRAAARDHLAFFTGSRLLKGYRGGHVVIRFALGGCANRPFFRIVAAHSKRARDGKYLEQLGCLDPLPNVHGERVAGLNLERLRYWLGCGAQLSRPAEKLLGLAGFLPLHPMTVTGAERLRQRRQRAQQVGTAPADGP